MAALTRSERLRSGPEHLDPKSTVIGFGKGTVSVIRTDDEDLQYMERYRR